MTLDFYKFKRTVNEYRIKTTEIDNIPITKVTYGEITGLPDYSPDIIYIVSFVTASACQRDDLYIPGEMVRDEAGRIIGCKGLTSSHSLK
jgi:hypothetical protein